MKTALALAIAIGAISFACSGDDSGGGPPTVEIIDVETGVGVPVADGDRIDVHYIGYLADGTVFDSSYDRGEPFTFELGAGEGKAGWDEGVPGMARGGFRRLIIPAELAYGNRAVGDIPPNSELTFEIELIGLNSCQQPDISPPPLDVAAETFTTEGGVRVIIIGTGSAEDPSRLGDNVSMHYTGWLTADGTMFDSSLNDCDQFTFILGNGQVIQGWEEGILGMSPGDIRRLIIPAELAYGEAGRTGIPPGASLTFDVELVAFGRNVPAE